jgi:predicted nucleic acid-binding Zn ribbon protein
MYLPFFCKSIPTSMTAEIQTAHCLNCDKTLKGRTDKKFCDDYCRNSYNNQLKSTKNNLVRNINNALGKNRRILESFLKPEEETANIHKDKLLEKGFQFKYLTHTYTTQKGKVYFFCYDLGYMRLDNDWYLLVKRKDGKPVAN